MKADDVDPGLALQQVFAAASEEERPLLFPALEGDGPGRERYATWLEGHDPTRAEALRLAISLERADDPAAAERLRKLLPALDPSWWRLMQRARIQNCGAGRARSPRVRFRLVCPRAWTTLQPTADPLARACEGCGEIVHRCESVAEASERARRGECVAVEPALAREAIDDGRLLMVGRPDYFAMWAERLFPEG